MAAEGSKIGRRHVKTLVGLMGIEALYRRPQARASHKIYPYLLRCIEITRATKTLPTARSAMKCPRSTSRPAARQSSTRLAVQWIDASVGEMVAG